MSWLTDWLFRTLLSKLDVLDGRMDLLHMRQGSLYNRTYEMEYHMSQIIRAQLDEFKKVVADLGETVIKAVDKIVNADSVEEQEQIAAELKAEVAKVAGLDRSLEAAVGESKDPGPAVPSE